MKFKKIFSVFAICLFVCTVLMAAGLRFGMTGAVKQKVKELDKKVIKKKGETATTTTTIITTTTVKDTAAPSVISTKPENNDNNIAINRKIIAIFSEAMAPATISTATFILKQGATVVPGTVTYTGVTAVFTPGSDLVFIASYTATITNGVNDLAGNALVDEKEWTFETSSTTDTTAPTVRYTVPADAATDILLGANITATFSETMDPETITAATFTLMQGVTLVPGTVTPVGSLTTFDPTNDLTANTLYTAKITAGVKDLAGNLMADSTTWSFTTGATVAAGPQPVNLGTAGNFVILSKTGISVTGTTAITGDIGVSPAAATYITGFGLIADGSNTFAKSSIVTGNVYAANYAPPTPANMTTAISDMQTAFTDAAGRAIPTATELYAGDISGKTLAPGLYKWSSGVLITDVGVTLSGAANDVWIFQIAQNLTVANGAIVTLSGGAEAKNIFWQVSGQTTLGTTSQFKGNILCQTLIKMQTGAKMTGRALAQTAVTLDANAVVLP